MAAIGATHGMSDTLITVAVGMVIGTVADGLVAGMAADGAILITDTITTITHHATQEATRYIQVRLEEEVHPIVLRLYAHRTRLHAAAQDSIVLQALRLAAQPDNTVLQAQRHAARPGRFQDLRTQTQITNTTEAIQTQPQRDLQAPLHITVRQATPQVPVVAAAAALTTDAGKKTVLTV